MTISKKLLLIATFGLGIQINASNDVKSTPQSPKQYSIKEFNPAYDTQPVIDIFNDNRHWLSATEDSDSYQSFLKQCHNHPSCNIKILQENEKLAGYVIYRNRDYQGYITDLAVTHDLRNKGYGTLLIATAMKELNDKNIDSIKLACSSNNTSALNLYKKMGFKELHDTGYEIILQYEKNDTKDLI